MKLISLLVLSCALAVPTDPPSSPPPPPAPASNPSLPSPADYRLLYDLLREHIEDNSDNVAHWARSAFHDLANYGWDGKKGGGPHGCMRDDPVRTMAQNSQLDGTIRKLNRLIHSNLPGIPYPFGDVISMAGKVAIEYAFPCIRIKWRPGRPPCGEEQEAGPAADFQTYNDFNGHLKRYGFTPREFGVLLSGAHALKEAKLHLRNSELPWTTKNSGVQFIQDSLDKKWTAIPGENMQLQTPMTHFYKAGGLIRLPVDLMFFPTTVKEAKSRSTISSRIKVEEDANQDEAYLQSLVTSDEVLFNNQFADIFAKMLEIGVDGATMGPWYEDHPNPHLENPSSVCPKGWYYSKYPQ